jgi:PEP-CTERM motif-containing protein
MQDSRHVAGKTFRSAFRAILCMIGVGVIPLANAQSFWEYSAQGSFFGRDGTTSQISGSVLIDGTVRTWNSPNLPLVFPNPNNTHAFLISSFDLDIGSLDFFGGGGGTTNSLYMQIMEPAPGSFAFGITEWFLAGSGDFTTAFGGVGIDAGPTIFFNADGTRPSVEDIFQAPPELVRMAGGFYCSGSGFPCGEVLQMDFTRVAQVAPIPEPEIYAMIGVGLGLVTWVARRKKLKESAPA